MKVTIIPIVIGAFGTVTKCIELRSPGPLTNTLTIMPMSGISKYKDLEIEMKKKKNGTLKLPSYQQQW